MRQWLCGKPSKMLNEMLNLKHRRWCSWGQQQKGSWRCVMFQLKRTRLRHVCRVLISVKEFKTKRVPEVDCLYFESQCKFYHRTLLFLCLAQQQWSLQLPLLNLLHWNHLISLSTNQSLNLQKIPTAGFSHLQKNCNSSIRVLLEVVICFLSLLKSYRKCTFERHWGQESFFLTRSTSPTL